MSRGSARVSTTPSSTAQKKLSEPSSFIRRIERQKYSPPTFTASG